MTPVLERRGLCAFGGRAMRTGRCVPRGQPGLRRTERVLSVHRDLASQRP